MIRLYAGERRTRCVAQQFVVVDADDGYLFWNGHLFGMTGLDHLHGHVVGCGHHGGGPGELGEEICKLVGLVQPEWCKRGFRELHAESALSQG